MPKRRRLPLRHFVTALGLATIVAVVWSVAQRPDEPVPPVPTAAPARTTPGGAPGPTTPTPPERAATTTETPRAPTPAEPASAGSPLTEAPRPIETPPSGVRTVTGPGIAPLPPAAAPPVRIEPPKPPPPPAAPIRPRRLMPVAMEDTATFTTGDLRVRLPGVAVIGPEETCRDKAGTVWPCGRRALAGVRAVVRGRAVDCPLPEKVRRGDFVADCTVGGADLAERLVASGWARALDREGRLVEAERAAEQKGLGLHAPVAPQAVDTLPAPADRPPPDTTTAPLGAGEGGQIGSGPVGEGRNGAGAPFDPRRLVAPPASEPEPAE